MISVDVQWKTTVTQSRFNHDPITARLQCASVIRSTTERLTKHHTLCTRKHAQVIIIQTM